MPSSREIAALVEEIDKCGSDTHVDLLKADPQKAQRGERTEGGSDTPGQWGERIEGGIDAPGLRPPD